MAHKQLKIKYLFVNFEMQKKSFSSINSVCLLSEYCSMTTTLNKLVLGVLERKYYNDIIYD